MRPSCKAAISSRYGDRTGQFGQRRDKEHRRASARDTITAPKLKIIVRRNEPHCPDVHRRGITKVPRCGARISAPTDPNHAEPEIPRPRPASEPSDALSGW